MAAKPYRQAKTVEPREMRSASVTNQINRHWSRLLSPQMSKFFMKMTTGRHALHVKRGKLWHFEDDLVLKSFIYMEILELWRQAALLFFVTESCMSIFIKPESRSGPNILNFPLRHHQDLLFSRVIKEIIQE